MLIPHRHNSDHLDMFLRLHSTSLTGPPPSLVVSLVEPKVGGDMLLWTSSYCELYVMACGKPTSLRTRCVGSGLRGPMYCVLCGVSGMASWTKLFELCWKCVCPVCVFPSWLLQLVYHSRWAIKVIFRVRTGLAWGWVQSLGAAARGFWVGGRGQIFMDQFWSLHVSVEYS